MTAGPSVARKTSRVCPICGKPADPADYPFCSRRCADVDLHRWLGGVYAVPAEDEGDESLPDRHADPYADEP